MPLLRYRSRTSSENADTPSARVIGIDASLSSTGYAYTYNGKLITGCITTHPLKGPHRLFYTRLQLGKILDLANPTLAVVEDYAMGARGNNMFHIGELGGVLKVLLWERGIDLITVPPTTMKSVIALDGRADKAKIAMALKVRFGMTVTQHDEADAAGFMLLGEMKAGTRKIDRKAGESDRFKAVSALGVVKGKLSLISKPR